MFYRNLNGSFKILGIFYVERKKREISELGRKHTSIAYRLEGNSTFFTKEETQFAGTGSVSYIPSGCAFKRKTEGAEKLIVLHLEPLGSPDKTLQIKSSATELYPLFRQLLMLWEEKGTEAYNQCMSLLYRIFSSLEQLGENGAILPPDSILAGVKKLEKDYRDSRLTAASLALESGVSESYFRRCYFSCYRESPWQTILKLRFQNACSLLSSGYYSPKQAAELSGFSDVKYFRTAFKKRFGVSPSQYAANK